MYIIRLDQNEGYMYKAIYDEGFRSTLNIEEATTFATEQEAQKLIENTIIKNIYQTAQVERIKK
jgi:hypothetical protein